MIGFFRLSAALRQAQLGCGPKVVLAATGAFSSRQ